MALLGVVTKQSREVVDTDILYTTYLSTRSAVTIISFTSESTPAGLTIDPQLFTGDRIKVTISGGTNGILYKVTVLATTSEGMILEDEFHVSIKNI